MGLATQAAGRIRRLIVGRKLKPGEVIATEVELASAMGVSRNAMREAVGQLRGLGLVDSRQCKGLVVARPDPAEVLRLVIPQYAIDQATFEELAELRYGIEMGAADLAIERGTPAQMAKLLRLAREHRKAAGNPRRVDAIDIQFHKTILSATRSRLLQSLHFVVASFFRRAKGEVPGWNAKPGPPQEHTLLAKAFADRDVDRARRLLSEHLRKYIVPAEPARHSQNATRD